MQLDQFTDFNGNIFFFFNLTIRQNGNPTASQGSAEDEEENDLTPFQQGLPQFLAVGVKNILLLGYGMTLGFPTIIIPAIMGGEGREATIHGEIVLNKDQISWFSKDFFFVTILIR